MRELGDGGGVMSGNRPSNGMLGLNHNVEPNHTQAHIQLPNTIWIFTLLLVPAPKIFFDSASVFIPSKPCLNWNDTFISIKSNFFLKLSPILRKSFQNYIQLPKLTPDFRIWSLISILPLKRIFNTSQYENFENQFYNKIKFWIMKYLKKL